MGGKLFFAFFFGALLLAQGCEKGHKDVIFDFSENLPAAISYSQSIISRLDVNGKPLSSLVQKAFVRNDAIFQPPITNLDYFLSIPKNSALKFGIVIENKFKDKNRFYDFEIFVKKQNSEPESIFSKRITAEDSGFFRQWLENAVDMGYYDNEVVKISFKLSSNQVGGEEKINLGWGRPALVSTAPLIPEKMVDKGENKKDKNSKEQPNIIIYLVDALRADHLGCYGYQKNTSPNIDKFSKDGILFENAIAQASWTQPAVASLFTGLYPSRHLVRNIKNALKDEVKTLAEFLKEKNIRTGAFIKNPIVNAEVGFSQGFEFFKLFKESEKAQINKRSFEWIDEAKSKPFFLYTHRIEPHHPYLPPKNFYKDFKVEYSGKMDGSDKTMQSLRKGTWPEEVTNMDVNYLISLYDGSIAYADYTFGQFIDGLKERNLYEKSLIIFLADHGEEFHDHGSFTHGHSLYAELTHIPLIFKLPGNTYPGEKIQEIARQVDILPTILDFLSDSGPAGEGLSLKKQIMGKKRAERFGFSERGPLKSIVYNGYKLIRKSEDQYELYNLLKDPHEKQSILVENEVIAGFLYQNLFYLEKKGGEYQKKAGKPERVELSDNLQKQLKSLGYLQ